MCRQLCEHIYNVCFRNDLVFSTVQLKVAPMPTQQKRKQFLQPPPQCSARQGWGRAFEIRHRKSSPPRPPQCGTTLALSSEAEYHLTLQIHLLHFGALPFAFWPFSLNTYCKYTGVENTWVQSSFAMHTHPSAFINWCPPHPHTTLLVLVLLVPLALLLLLVPRVY